MKEGKKGSSSALSMAVAVVGFILIIAGGGYALYERYVVGGTRLSTLAFNPLVDALGIVGVILLIAGIAMYYRAKAPKSPAPVMSGSGSSSTGSGRGTGTGGQKGGGGTSKPGAGKRPQ
jgi:hypothetical protein